MQLECNVLSICFFALAIQQTGQHHQLTHTDVPFGIKPQGGD